MDRPGGANGPPERDTRAEESAALRRYYSEGDFLMSAEGVLKVLSVVAGVASSALLLRGGACAGAPWLASGGAAVAVACAALTACLYAGAVAPLAAYVPHAWLYTDIVLSTALGIMLLVSAVLGLTFCDMTGVTSYVHGPLAIVNAGMVTGSAVITYASVMQRLDAASVPRPDPRPSQPTELEV